ncbi:DNA/RNA non-specific endonuclease [Sphingomonas phyllosphaerae]|uniref:DNA/RNA non-specific endonuclease n=1 Tax=Sphingomonas phyllosphaerae TaxID=257003 RepID=UPI003D6B4E7B
MAARSNGPTDAFDHFAQDANFNRGLYRSMEDQWARSKHEGRDIEVQIRPAFDGSSVRPSTKDVFWKVNGSEHSVKFRDQSRKQR